MQESPPAESETTMDEVNDSAHATTPMPPPPRYQDASPPRLDHPPESPPPSYQDVLAEKGLEAQAEPLASKSAPVERRDKKKQKPMSTKMLYRVLASQRGITCKMSDNCRCLECQSQYFDCEYEQNEQEKTDGGLGAGTPVFISEVMGGSACNVL